jgi:hypothetical protein
MNPAMASLLDSLQASGTGSAFRGHDVYAQDGIDYRTLQQQQLASLSNTHSFSNPRPFVPHGLGIAPAQTQAHGGYTATEEFILRARSNSLPQKRRPVPLDLTQTRHHEMDSIGANIGMGVRGYRTQASTLSFPHQQHHGLSPMFDSQDSMNMNEEDFHAASSIPHQLPGRPQQQQFENGERIMKQLNAHALHTQQQQHTNTSSRLPRTQSQQQQHLSASLRGPSQNHDFIRTRPLAANQQTHHYQHNLTGNSNAHAHARNMNLRPAQANNNMMNTNNNNSSLGNSNGIYERNARDSMAQRGTTHRHNGGNSSSSYSGGSHSHSLMYSSHSQADVDQASPPLVSPALTYSSRSSVAFSPTTPFFGSFDEDETTFRAPQMDVKGKKINSRTATR